MLIECIYKTDNTAGKAFNFSCGIQATYKQTFYSLFASRGRIAYLFLGEAS